MLIEELKKILDSENIKESLEELIENLEEDDGEEEKEEVEEGKDGDDIKETVKEAIRELKEENISLSEVETEDRPIFQLNFSDANFSEEGTNKFRKQILKKGEWYHTNAAGGKLTIDDKMLDTIVQNFNEGLIENVAVPVRHTQDPIKNTGEVTELKKTENGLEAIIEVRDENAADKIAKGLVKGISASIDPNYVRKDTGESVGPVLRHAALVMEPFIKGLGEFVQLSDVDEDRKVVQLSESKEDNIYEVVKEFTKTVSELKEKIEEMSEKGEDEEEEVKESKEEEIEEGEEEKKEEEIKESKDEEEEEEKEIKESAKCKKDDETKEECVNRKVPELIDEGYDEDEAVAAAENMCSEACSEQSKEEQEDEVEVEEKKEEDKEEAEEEKEVKESAEKEEKEEAEEEKIEEKKEESEDEEEVKECKEEEEEEAEEEVEESKEDEQEDTRNEKEEKTQEDVYRECMKEELNKGKGMVKAAKACKQKLDLEDKSEVKSDLKSKEEGDDQGANISLSDAKELYDEYLQKGRVTPSQKDDFIELAQDLGDRINLSDSNSKVGGLDKLKKFLDKQPKVIDFEEKGEGAKVKKDTAGGDGDIPEEVKSLYSKMNLSEDQMKRAYRNAKKMKEDERKQDEKSIL